MVLKAGLACSLHDGEDSESTAMCVERVAADLMGLVSAVATALRRELKQPSPSVDDEALVRQWCEFYAEELLPETKKFCKKVTGKLDAYGLYLPSRMSATLSPELLERGLKLGSGGPSEKGEDVGGDEKDGGATGEEELADEDKSEACAAEEEADGGAAANVGEASPSASADADAPTPRDEDEYDDEYDEYDEYD